MVIMNFHGEETSKCALVIVVSVGRSQTPYQCHRAIHEALTVSPCQTQPCKKQMDLVTVTVTRSQSRYHYLNVQANHSEGPACTFSVTQLSPLHSDIHCALSLSLGLSLSLSCH